LGRGYIKKNISMKLVSSSLNEFQKGQDPREVMGIGERAKINDWFDKLYPKDRNWGPEKPEYHINDDLTIDVNGDIQLGYGLEEIPEFIKFRNIYGDLEVMGVQEMPNLDWLPKLVDGDFKFYRNPIRLTPKKLKDLGVEVLGETELLDPYTKSHRESSKRYRERGPLKDRVSHKLSDLGVPGAEYGPKFSKGYLLYKALKYIKSKGKEGARYTDITGLIFRLSHPGQDKPWNSGWGVGYFSPKNNSPIGTKADKNEAGRWVINAKGEKYLEDYKDLFED
jgi:hypothetical protein